MITDFGYIDPIRLEIDPIDSPNIIRVWADFRIGFKLNGHDKVYTVPAGTVTDFASIPRAFQGLIEKIGAHIPAAIVHDRLCIDQGPWDSETAAEIFLAGMRASRVPDETRRLMYLAVREYGPRWSV